MMVNGKPRWTCRTHVQKVLDRDGIEIAPLRNLPVIKDLVADMTEFFDQMDQGRGPISSDGDEGRWDRPRSAQFARTPGGERRNRMHQLRGLLCGLRRGRIEPELSRAGGAQPRLDAGQRCAGRWK